jgi:hypothetical protein
MDVAVRNALEQIQTAARSIDELVSIKAVAAADAIGNRSPRSTASSPSRPTSSPAGQDRSAQLENSLLNHGNIVLQQRWRSTPARPRS